MCVFETWFCNSLSEEPVWTGEEQTSTQQQDYGAGECEGLKQGKTSLLHL